jgi:hypothetical protein
MNLTPLFAHPGPKLAVNGDSGACAAQSRKYDQPN